MSYSFRRVRIFDHTGSLRRADPIWQRSKLGILVSDRFFRNAHYSEAASAIPQGHTYRTCRDRFDVSVLGQGIPMVVTRQEIAHSGASKHLQQRSAAQPWNVEVLIRFVRSRQKPWMVLKHNYVSRSGT